jgi:hypothetical protein
VTYERSGGGEDPDGGARSADFVRADANRTGRQYSKEMALMLEWFERIGYSADIAGLEREFGRSLMKLPDWARRHARPNGR